jgi:hypothetical protein
VPLEHSTQWRFFQQCVRTLTRRGNRVFVVVGPLNEHMLDDASRAAHGQLRRGVAAWLEQQRIPFDAPALLPSELYADASHPLAAGYEQMAKRLLRKMPPEMTGGA